jgi:hypothetical protein
MRKIRLFLTEDDHFQREAIFEALRDLGRAQGLAIECSEFGDEKSARDELRVGLRRLPEPPFDAYVIDMMLPWSQDEHVDEPDDPRVRQEGPLYAGVRVADDAIALRDRLHGASGRSASGPRAPIILYTIAANGRAKEFNLRAPDTYWLRKGEDDGKLAEMIFKLILRQ